MDKVEDPLPSLLWYYEAFNFLGLGRPMGGFAPGAIPLSEMESYLNIHEIYDFDNRRLFVRIIRALDAVWLKYQSEKTGK